MIVYSFKNIKSKEQTTETKQKEGITNKEENHMLSEMMSDLEKYKSDLTELVMHRKHFENENFKKSFFPSLENLLNQVIFIRDKKLKEEKIENVYKWYKTKWKYFTDLNQITKKTKKFDYEYHPSLDKKSDYYEAGNFPLFYETDNRTEETGIMPPKDRLKNFITKKIIKEKDEKIKEQPKSTTEKERLLSATDSAMRSTNTTNFFNTSTNFFKSNNETLRDEIKSSYSTYRPQYNHGNLTIEKMIETTKHRELADKRNKDEMKEFLNEFGMNRAKFKSEVEKKIETKIIIKHYEKNLKDESEYEYEIPHQEQLAKFKRDNSIKNNSTSKFSSSSTVRNQSTIRIEEKRKTSTINLTIQKQATIKPKVPIKVNISNIKNLNVDNKITTNPDEIVVNIKMKNSNIKNKEILFTESKAKENIPNDLMAVNTDKITDLRNKYSKMLNVKEVDTGKENYKDHFTPLSAYDSVNAEIFKISPYEKLRSNRPLTSYEFVRNNFESNDLLHQRKTLSKLKFREMNRLTETVQKNKKHTKLFSQIQEAFLPHEDHVYPKYYLPFPDYGMLTKPLEVAEKKKRLKGK